MSLIKETLHNAINSLNDDEARMLLEYIKYIKNQKDLFQILAGDPTFELPSKEHSDFPKINPVVSHGISVSESLIKDRK